MPKWVLKALFLLLSPFVLYWLACVLVPPPDTIEYHVGAYIKECDVSGFDVGVETRAPRFLVELRRQRRNGRIDKHRRALVRLRFLRQNTIVVSNASATDVMFKAVSDNLHRVATGPFFHWEFPATNVIEVTTPAEVQIWPELIRRADTPETTEWAKTPMQLKPQLVKPKKIY